MDRRRFLTISGVGACGLAMHETGRQAAAGEDAMDWPIPFPIVDTHVHFWDPSNLRYPWLDRSELLNRPYLPADYIAAAGPVEVGRIVFVQAACIREQAMEEVAWVTALAADEPRIQGIVADAPLELGAGAAPVLERLAGNPLVKGVRRMLQGEKEPEFCLQPGFVEGTKRLGQAGLSFDMGITRHQLPAVTDLARRCPEVRFMLCHIGVPDIRGGQLDPWREQLRDLAALPNVYCKLSGVATAADPQTWTREDLRPAIDHVFDCFRFERVAFGSDWPVMLRATPFPRWAATAAWATAECTAAERRRVFRDTAESFYGLGGA